MAKTILSGILFNTPVEMIFDHKTDRAFSVETVKKIVKKLVEVNSQKTVTRVTQGIYGEGPEVRGLLIDCWDGDQYIGQLVATNKD